MTDNIHHIPLTDINPNALPRDRTSEDPEADYELMQSIFIDGLRQPVEVWELSEQTDDGHRYGLISGFRRLTACTTLEKDTIPALLRTPESIPKAVTAMVAENEIRSQISPWEKVRLILQCLGEGIFPTPDAAISTLFPLSSRQKTARLRGLVPVVQRFDGLLSAPERLTTRRLDQLTSAMNAGYEDLLLNALSPSRAPPRPKPSGRRWPQCCKRRSTPAPPIRPPARAAIPAASAPSATVWSSAENSPAPVGSCGFQAARPSHRASSTT